jgi:hypothetical protein
MENEQRKIVGVNLANSIFKAFEYTFEKEDFLNAAQMKVWLGSCVKAGAAGGYRNLSWKDYRAVFDYILYGEFVYHVGVDFGQQAIHVTLEAGDVYSLYYRNPCGHE